MEQNKFITFEGADGTGKTTQIALLAQKLEEVGYSVVITREPGGTQVAEKIRELVLDPAMRISPATETLLYLAARAQHVAEVIAPALAAGKIVLCDRFVDSTLVYQGLTRGMDMEAISYINTFATGGITPSLTILLDGDTKILAERRVLRGVEDRFELEGLAFQEKVKQGFLFLAKAEPKRMQVVQAGATEDVVAAQVWQLVQDSLAL